MKKDNEGIKKIIFEIILIPLCIIYLLYTLLLDHKGVSEVLCISFIIITSLVFIIKYIKEVYIFENKYNVFKVIYSIFSVLLIVVSVLKIIFSISIINILFYVFTVILLVYLCLYVIKNIFDIKKDNGKFYKKVFLVFLSIDSFVFILTTLILSIK